MENKTVHIGNMLQAYRKTKRIYAAAWARHQGVQKKTVTGYFKKSTMQTDTLFAICHVLKYNFFADLAAELPGDYGRKNSVQDDKMTALEKKNAELKIQVELLKELVRK